MSRVSQEASWRAHGLAHFAHRPLLQSRWEMGRGTARQGLGQEALVQAQVSDEEGLEQVGSSGGARVPWVPSPEPADGDCEGHG